MSVVNVSYWFDTTPIMWAVCCYVCCFSETKTKKCDHERKESEMPTPPPAMTKRGRSRTRKQANSV